jgi:alkylated DNA repair protein alkB family protein 1
MGGHADDLEYDFTKPVISISLGRSAIFLLGQTQKELEPVVPILVRPGDVMLLAGGSRLCYHGMARVLPFDVDVVAPRLSNSNSCSQIDSDDSNHDDDRMNEFQITTKMLTMSCEEADDMLIPPSDCRAVDEYLSNHRININIRQVLPSHISRIKDILK